MNEDCELLILALEALLWEVGSDPAVYTAQAAQAIKALRAALAEPEPEPVAWMESPYGAIRANPLYKITAPQSVEWSIPLYAALAEPDEVATAVAAEREACARACELLRPSKREYDHRFWDACTASAAVIRARKISERKVCSACERYFEKFSCGANITGECDCPRCQGFCNCEGTK